MANRSVPAAESRRRYEAFVANDKQGTRAALALGLPEATFRYWLREFRRAMSNHEALLTADHEPTELFWGALAEEQKQAAVAPAGKPVKEDRDAVAEARRKAEIKRLSDENKELLKRAVKAEDFRSSIFGLTTPPLEPVSFQPARQNPKGPSAETVIVMLSDWQWGEVVDLGMMDGINSYNPKIASARCERCFQAILDLSTKHWAGPPPARLIVILGGDMVSGEIHEELKKTNALMAIPAARDVTRHLNAGLDLLRTNLKCPIDIISLPGNHGRSTLKNESKLLAETSYDNLVADFMESEWRAEKRFTFYVPQSGDAVFSIYGWRFLATHGHNIGSRGGMGFVGPAATAARGFKRLIADYAARGIHIDTILMGHFHTALHLEEGFVNSSLVGPSEFSRDGRYRPRPASQLFLAVHPRRMISQVRFINVGAPEEGTLYERPDTPSELVRPRYRVPAAR